MSVNLRYISSTTGETFYFQASNPVKTKTANFHNYSWLPRTFAFEYGEELQGFGKSSITYNMELWLSGAKSTRVQWLDSFHFACDCDIVNKTPGRLYWEDMYIECFIISTSTYPAEGNQRTVNDISVFAPYPSWIYEWTYGHLPFTAAQVADRMGVSASRVTIHDIIDSARPFYTPFRSIPSDFRMLIINNTGSAVSSQFIGTIYTPLGNTECQFETTLPAGEAALIDSRHGRKTAELCTVPSSGAPVPYSNIYKDRHPYSRPFKRLNFMTGNFTGLTPQTGKGQFYFQTNGQLLAGLMCTIFYERSEPTWISS